jgi:hypothetical protein
VRDRLPLDEVQRRVVVLGAALVLLPGSGSMTERKYCVEPSFSPRSICTRPRGRSNASRRVISTTFE